MQHYCTYFDGRYLGRALALYESLRRHAQPFTLWALCLDDEAEAALRRLDRPDLRPVGLWELEAVDTALVATKGGRSRAEYYFTCTPAWLHHLLERRPEITLLTYLDADLWFFASPAPLFEELGDGSIQLIEHRFPPRLGHLEDYGRFNVGWLTVRRDESGLAFVRWWRERCLEWCYNRLEDGRYADQGYLDEAPTRFVGVVVARHPGANLALWNVEGVTLAAAGDRVLADERPLLFYHFHNLREVAAGWYDAGGDHYSLSLSRPLRRLVYAPYLVALGRSRRLLGLPPAGPIRHSARAILRRLRFHRSLVVVGPAVIGVDVTEFFGLAARVWRPVKLALRRVSGG